MGEYLTIREASSILKVPEFQIYNLAAGGMIGAFKIGKHWRIPTDNFQEYINKQIKLNNLR